MTPALEITEVRFTAAGGELPATGLLGWVSCTVNGALRVDGITLRRTREGRLSLSWPARTDGRGQRHFYLRPLGDATRIAFESAVFEALALEGGESPR